MYILQHPNGNEAHANYDAACTAFSEWGWGELRDALNEDFPQVSGFDVDINDPTTMSHDFMSVTFSHNGDVILEGVSSEDEAALLDMYAEFERYKDCYQAEDTEAFDDEAFTAYWALVQAERAGNTNIRRKDSLHNPERNGRFCMNLRLNRTDQISLSVCRTSLEQFNLIGVAHPFKHKILRNIESHYANLEKDAQAERKQNEKRLWDINYQIESLNRQIKALTREKEGLESIGAELAAREERVIERLRTDLSIDLRNLGATN